MEVLEVFRCLAPMILAVVFDYTAAVFASLGIQNKTERKIAFVGAIIIVLVSFTIWLPCFSDLFNIIGWHAVVKQKAMIIAISVVLLGTIIAMLFNLKKEKT